MLSILSLLLLSVQKKPAEWVPPALPGGQAFVTDRSGAFIRIPGGVRLRDGVTVAKAVPTIDFAYFPGQTYAGRPWSNWGDGTFANGKYYSAIGDHLAPAGNAYVYEYEPAKKTFRKLVDLKTLLDRPEGHYSPSKIHTTLTFGRDGWLYFGTHRGSTTVTTDKYHYEGDWLVRVHPEGPKAEVVVQAPVAKHCIPTGFLDPERLIFHGGTAPGVGKDDATGVHYFAYDVQKKKVVCDVADGPPRAMIFAKSTGRVYYVPASGSGLMRFDPAAGGNPVKVPGEIGLRAASAETKDGVVYTVSNGQGGREPMLYAFDTKTEKITDLGSALVGSVGYITALKIDPAGRFLYYIPGAHGGADKDGSPVVQFDVKTKTKKVIAFLHPHFQEKYAVAPVGTYSYSLDAEGATLFVTWNANRGGKSWDVCVLTAVHIPASERGTN
jgi:hypothetical protein